MPKLFCEITYSVQGHKEIQFAFATKIMENTK